MCGVNRKDKIGFCGACSKITLALYSLHKFEEPIISGKNGSGTVFFSGCNLRCVYCQNFLVSRNQIGKKISIPRLAKIFKELETKGAHNINLVTPTHYVDKIIKALKIYRPKIPIIYNTSGYEKKETIKKLAKYIDVYLTDFKYYDNNLALRLSNVNNYLEIASEALKQMILNQPKNVFENGLIQKGVVVRHLVLPNHSDDSVKVIEHLHNKFGNKVLLSLMSQYVAIKENIKFKEIQRPLKSIEYNKVLKKVWELGFDGYCQDMESSSFDYVPQFNNFIKKNS